MGGASSQLERDIGNEFPLNEHYYGLINFGNTCYCNSVLQALFYCRPFRDKVLRYPLEKPRKETLLYCLHDLFSSITSQKKKTGVFAPKKFISRLRKENENYNNFLQQDAHEFLNFLLNTVADLLRSEEADDGTTEKPTWVQEIFEGIITNETRCLTCETVSCKDEPFLDLSVDIEQNTSLNHCLRSFSSTETLMGAQKYFCEACCSKQEAQKRMRIKKQPKILALHLKRFKYIENDNRYKKLTYRVVFPLELRLFITSENANNPECLYSLISVVVHCGNGPNKGHYICAVKSHDFWLIFDDDVVEKVDEKSIEDFFGNENPRNSNGLEVGYILFYEAMENDTALHPYSAPPHPPPPSRATPSNSVPSRTSNSVPSRSGPSHSVASNSLAS